MGLHYGSTPKRKPPKWPARTSKRYSSKNKKCLKILTKKNICLVQESNLGLLLPFCGGGIFAQGVKIHPDVFAVYIGTAAGHRTRSLQLFFVTC